MVWTLDLDDVKGTFCGTGPFPLVSKLHSFLVQAGKYLWLGSGVGSRSFRSAGFGETAWHRRKRTNFDVRPVHFLGLEAGSI